jgi:hypothetical protein
MSTRESRLRWWLTPVTFAFGSLILDASIVATDYVARGRIASAAPHTNVRSPTKHGGSAEWHVVWFETGPVCPSR